MEIDLTVILTGIGTAFAIIGANITLISWLRGDMKIFEQEIRGWKDEFKNDIFSYKEEIHAYKDEVRKEMKDFHGRLCTIEAKSRNVSTAHKEKAPRKLG